MKRCAKILVALSLSLVFSVSFCNTVYAAGKDFDDWKDSYISEGENDSLIFFPIVPNPDEDYLIIQGTFSKTGKRGKYCLQSSGFLRQWTWSGSYWEDGYKLYILNEKSYDWDFVMEVPFAYTQNYRWSDVGIYDSTLLVAGVSIWTGNYEIKYTNRTGYKYYWNLTLVLRFILSWVDKICVYILDNEILRYAVLVGFVGEVFFFVFQIIKKIGERRADEEDS